MKKHANRKGKTWSPEQRAKYRRTLRKKSREAAASIGPSFEETAEQSETHEILITRASRKPSERIKELTQQVMELTGARDSAMKQVTEHHEQALKYFPAAWDAIVHLFDSFSPHNKRGIIRELVNRI